ncbi:hypothetical protein E3N88_23570 [Mikania micrantha]|uniref:CCHC-type domain-containing protein n=1 Tax=Mikania micrantha TaxID=192012 RepID=A0A5N6NES0_9ASTR|nr:hypothetical protein E3N88_23570 [Mikania micrantha]
MAEDGKVKIEKFDGHDYGYWRMQVEDLLYQKSLHLPMLGLSYRPEKMTDAEWNLLDRQALGVVRLSLSKSVAYNIVKETTTFGVLKALSNMYEKPSASNKVFLIRQLVNTKLKEGMSITAHINEFNSVISRLASVDINFEDEIQALLLLSSLPDSWSGTVTAVSSSSGTTKLTFDGIRDIILSEDIRRRSSGESSSTLLNTEGRGRRNERGHSRGRSKSRKRGQSKNRKEIECWNCKEKGHFKSQCPKPLVAKGKMQMNNVTDDESDDALICEEIDAANICCVGNSVESWILDSGASFHAVSSPDLIKNLRIGNLGKVRLADDQTLDIAGIGDVDLRTSLGTVWTLKDVRVIPNLRRKLISVGNFPAFPPLPDIFFSFKNTTTHKSRCENKNEETLPSGAELRPPDVATLGVVLLCQKYGFKSRVPCLVGDE